MQFGMEEMETRKDPESCMQGNFYGPFLLWRGKQRWTPYMKYFRTGTIQRNSYFFFCFTLSFLQPGKPKGLEFNWVHKCKSINSQSRQKAIRKRWSEKTVPGGFRAVNKQTNIEANQTVLPSSPYKKETGQGNLCQKSLFCCCISAHATHL